MKTFLVLALTVTALFLWQRNASQRTAAPPSEKVRLSQERWNQSLVRTQSVVEQVQAAREQSLHR